MRGYSELRGGAAWLDVSGRYKIRAAGEDRVRLLHAMTTNHIQQLTAGSGCYAFFLTAQRRILADVNVLCRNDSFLLDTEPETQRKLLEHLDKFIIADDVTLEDLTPALATIAVEGPKSPDVLGAARAPALDICYGLTWSGGRSGGQTECYGRSRRFRDSARRGEGRNPEKNRGGGRGTCG